MPVGVRMAGKRAGGSEGWWEDGDSIWRTACLKGVREGGWTGGLMGDCTSERRSKRAAGEPRGGCDVRRLVGGKRLSGGHPQCGHHDHDQRALEDVVMVAEVTCNTHCHLSVRKRPYFISAIRRKR